MQILLTTLHSRHSHSSLALPMLAASCANIPDSSCAIREFTINEPHEQLLRNIVAQQADLVGFSCYIWNIDQTLRLIADLKRITPETIIAVGGPEVSFGIFDLMTSHPEIDLVIQGEGEQSFTRVIENIRQPPAANGLPDILADIEGVVFRQGDEIVAGPIRTGHLPLHELPSPFAAGLVDLAKPLVYYETSRGCPFACSFCMSSLEGKVRSYGMERIRADLALLMNQQVQRIKLVDRTFNFDPGRADAIWDFILKHNRTSQFHFEIAADLLTNDNFATLSRVPEHQFHFEIGVQSTGEGVLKSAGRPVNMPRLLENVRRLKRETGIELHLDLLAGLPGEDYQGFLDSLQHVCEVAPHQIQVEPLKVLKGSKMRAVAEQEKIRYSPHPPYKILRTPWLSFAEIDRIETIGRLLDLFYNSGLFQGSLELLGHDAGLAPLFDRMARSVTPGELTGRSLLDRFELLHRLAAPQLDSATASGLRDALFFDYCLTEVPVKNRLPDFAQGYRDSCNWPQTASGFDPPEAPGTARVKFFRCRFLTDRRAVTADAAPTEVTFRYLAEPGRKLRIEFNRADKVPAAA